MSINTLIDIEERLANTQDTKQYLDLARAYAEIKKADLEETKADVETIIRRSQLENEAKKISNEARKIELESSNQKKRIYANSIDNGIMATALAGGIYLMYCAEREGVLLSRNANTLFRFLRFGRS